MGQKSRKLFTYSEYDAYFYFTYSKYLFYLFYFCVSWLLHTKQQSSETATSQQREIRIHWINPWWNKMLDFLYCLLEMVFSEFESKIVSIKLTTDEEKLRGEVKNWERIFMVRLADSKLNGKSGKILYLTACAVRKGGKCSCRNSLKVMVKKRMKTNSTRTEKVNEDKQEQVWTATSRCPNRLEDAMLSMTCYCEIFIFSALPSVLNILRLVSTSSP